MDGELPCTRSLQVSLFPPARSEGFRLQTEQESPSGVPVFTLVLLLKLLRPDDEADEHDASFDPTLAKDHREF